MIVLKDLGNSPTAIGEKLNRSHNTISKYLDSDVYKDPKIGKLVDVIKEKEVEDLYLLGGKARNNIHKLLDEGKMKAIENIACMDRVFQQRQLLTGKSTQNIYQLTTIIEAAHTQKGNGHGGDKPKNNGD